MRREAFLFVMSIVCVAFAQASASACSCGGPGTPCEAFGGSAAVFVGTVTEISGGPRKQEPGGQFDFAPRVVRFSVEQAFLGVEGVEAEVRTGLGGGDCGYAFVKGVSYVVYAYHSGKDKRLYTGICTRTRPAFGATEDLEYLRALATSPAGVTVFGKVLRRREDASDEGASTGASTSALVASSLTIEGEGVRREVSTDAEGRYKLSGLRPGTYKVTLHLSDELTTYQPERELKVEDRGCASADFYVADNGRIGGGVFDAEGKPVAGVGVVVVDAEGKNPNLKYGRHEKTDEEGRYKFSALPPGRYLLGIRLAGYPEQDDPTNAFARTYYPGVAEASDAEVLKLSAGQELTGRDLRLPSRRAESVIRGRVVWADGTPVGGASVHFRDVTYEDPGINYGAKADADGQFSIKTYVGAVYHIEVVSDRPYQGDPHRFEPMERFDPLTLTVTSPVETVTLVITKLR